MSSAPSAHATHAQTTRLPTLAVAALGVVFGDIGTSPLYALKESLHPGHGLSANPADVLGVLSLIVWSMTMVVTIKYLGFVMKADNRGEGGIFALFALLPERLRQGARRRSGALALLVIVGAALLYGDGVITPAISVLSAVEGLSVVTETFNRAVLPLTCVVLVVLFAIQRRGTARIGRVFGPVMVIWFVTIGCLGTYHVLRNPEVLWALSPTYAVAFFANHGGAGFAVLGSVFLAVTGGEALYADMGHFGARPIRLAWWVLVKPALVLCYLGQGALLLRHPEVVTHPFFAMVPRGPATVALVILAASATVIASQALISGAFSLTRQAIELGYLPRLAIRHTSHATEGQIYIPAVNWSLALGCLIVVLTFRESTRLAAAYGIAVTGTMAITSLLYFVVVRATWCWSLARALPLLLLFLAFDLPFLGANLLKIRDGGYVPILLGVALTGVMLIWKRGSQLVTDYYGGLERAEVVVPRVLAQATTRVPGTAVFMAHRMSAVGGTLVRYVSRIKTLHAHVVLLHVVTKPTPVMADDDRFEVADLGGGVFGLTAHHGFMESPDAPACLRVAARQGKLPVPLDDVTYFLGRETFMATERGRMGRVAETLFATLVRNATPADRHFRIPPEAVVELGTQVDL